MKLAARSACLMLLIVGCSQTPVSKPSSNNQSLRKQSELVDQSTALPGRDLSEDSSPVGTPAAGSSDAGSSNAPKSKTDSIVISPTPTNSDGAIVVDDGAADPKAIDLSKFYLMRAADFPKTGMPFNDLPRGKQQYGRVPVDVGGLIFLWGRQHASQGNIYPEYIEAIPVARKFESLYVYHFTRWKTADGTPVVRVILNYENEEHSAHEIRYGDHVRDWYWDEGDPDVIIDPSSKKVWQGKNPTKELGQLLTFMTEIKNPRPHQKVVSIDLVSALEETVPAILALTTGQADLLKE